MKPINIRGKLWVFSMGSDLTLFLVVQGRVMGEIFMEGLGFREGREGLHFMLQ